MKGSNIHIIEVKKVSLPEHITIVELSAQTLLDSVHDCTVFKIVAMNVYYWFSHDQQLCLIGSDQP